MPDSTGDYWAEVLLALRGRVPTLEEAKPNRLEMGKSPVFAVGDDAILKLIPPYWAEDAAREVAAMRMVAGDAPVATPRVLAVELVDGWTALLMSRVEGTILRSVWPSLDRAQRAVLASELGAFASWLHRQDVPANSPLPFDWDAYLSGERRGIEADLRKASIPTALQAGWPQLVGTANGYTGPEQYALVHGDLSAGNLLVSSHDGVFHLTGVLDFGDSVQNTPLHDWLSPNVHDFVGEPSVLEAFYRGYGLPDTARTQELQAYLLLRTLLYYGWAYVARKFALVEVSTWAEAAHAVWPM